MIDHVIGPLDRLSRREHFTGPDDLVFCNQVGDVMDESALRRRFYRALKSSVLKRVRLHDLRHSYCTLAVQGLPDRRGQGVRRARGHRDDDALRAPRSCARRRRPAVADRRRLRAPTRAPNRRHGAQLSTAQRTEISLSQSHVARVPTRIIIRVSGVRVPPPALARAPLTWGSCSVGHGRGRVCVRRARWADINWQR